MKLHGGYNFPGSTSTRDLYCLTGWIPERLRILEKGEVDGIRESVDRAWNRLISAHEFGDCLVTVSTGDISDQEEGATGLVGAHGYAVLDIRAAGILRMIQVSVFSRL